MKPKGLVLGGELHGIREGDFITVAGKVARVVKVDDEITITIKWLTWYQRLWRWVLSMRRLFIAPWLPKRDPLKKPKLAMWLKWHGCQKWWMPNWLWVKAVKQVDDWHIANIRDWQPKIREGFRKLRKLQAELKEEEEKNEEAVG